MLIDAPRNPGTGEHVIVRSRPCLPCWSPTSHGKDLASAQAVAVEITKSVKQLKLSKSRFGAVSRRLRAEGKLHTIHWMVLYQLSKEPCCAWLRVGEPAGLASP